MTEPTGPIDATAIAQVRLLIADVDPNREVFTDPDLHTFLTLEQGSVKRAAAAALDAIGTSELLTSKVIRTQDLTTDGAKVSAELRARADRLRTQADTADQAALAAEGGFFDVVPPGRGRAELTETWWG